MKSAMVFLILGCITTNVSAQEFNKAKLDSLFSILEINNKFMGSVALSHNGSIIYTNAIGFSDIEKGIESSSETQYRIGSISKMYTACLILKAVEEGKISLSQTIENYFPTIENSKKITIENLLNHRSGIFNFTNDFNYQIYQTQPKTEGQLIKIISSYKSQFEPGSKAEYSNSNYVLLTFILEKTYGKTFSELLKEKITKPFDLNNTYVGGKIDVDKNECYSYKYLTNWEKSSETNMSIPLGAGAIVSTPSDLVKFIEQLINGNIISTESLKLMKDIKDGFGLGMLKFPFHDKTVFGHTGGIDGFSSFLGIIEEDRVSFSYISNGTNFNNNDLIVAALSSFYGKPFELPNFEEAIVDANDLEKLIGLYSSKEIPLKISIKKEGNNLIAQATGQPAFKLTPNDKYVFRFDQAGLVMEFNPDEQKMVLKQGGSVFNFSKEE